MNIFQTSNKKCRVAVRGLSDNYLHFKMKHTMQTRDSLICQSEGYSTQATVKAWGSLVKEKGNIHMKLYGFFTTGLCFLFQFWDMFLISFRFLCILYFLSKDCVWLCSLNLYICTINIKSNIYYYITFQEKKLVSCTNFLLVIMF